MPYTSQSVHTLLEPGAAPDTSVVVIQRRIEGHRLHGGITLDNSGSEYVGRPMVSTLVVLENPIGLNDVLSLNAGSNLEHVGNSQRSQNLGASYSIPWDYHLFTFSDGYVRYAQVVQGTTAQFLSSGATRTVRGQWDLTLWRGASAKFGIFAALFTEQASSYLDDVAVTVQQLNMVNFDRGISSTIKLPSNGEINARLDYRTGLASDGARNDLPTAAVTAVAAVLPPTVSPLHSRRMNLAVPNTVPALSGYSVTEHMWPDGLIFVIGKQQRLLPFVRKHPLCANTLR